MVNTKRNTLENMVNKLQSFDGKTKLKFYQNANYHYDEIKYQRHNGSSQFDENPSKTIAEGFEKNFNGLSLLIKFLQTKPQVEGMKINYYDLYYTVNKNRDLKRTRRR